jgi:hypothetical protein
MRDELVESRSVGPAVHAGGGSGRRSDPTFTGAEETVVAKVLRSVPWVLGLVMMFAAGSAQTQGNIDAGKTPAQMFSETCSGCHRRPSELKRANASFLRQHYMSGPKEASAMAAYLSSGAPGAADRKDRLKAQQEKIKAAQEKAKTQQVQVREQGKTKGRKGAEAGKGAPEPPPPEITQRAEAPAVPKLEPFEE